MKTLQKFAFLALFITAGTLAIAQTKTESFKVSGNCGMCKSKIEKAAVAAGAKTATWNIETKELTINYNSTSTNTAKIQKNIAAVGYDNAGVKATDASYDKLHGCCKYERTAAADKAAKAACCADEANCTHGDGDHDAKADCCKDGKCSKEGQNCGDCCKDGKCTKEGHKGGDCCKKS